MNFKILVDQLNALNLPRDQYVVVGSGSMAAHGIREANDFDILVTEDLWQELEKKYEVKQFDGVANINIGDIQIVGKGSIFLKSDVASLDEMIQTANVVEGHRFLKLELLKKFKEKERREKDLKDVELIDTYLSNGR